MKVLRGRVIAVVVALLAVWLIIVAVEVVR
jgi:hypothetical protein